MYNIGQHFHFIGIGGTGMSSIAEILLRQGFSVSGSDLACGPVCDILKNLGATVAEGHDSSNVPDGTHYIVYSSAIPESNPEMQEARRRGLPLVHRAEVLAELMRLRFGIGIAGTHGKTTTTGIVSHLLVDAGLDPSCIVGGQVKSIGSGARLGSGNILVAESDESDRSFLFLKPSIAVVTNIEAEHMENYDSLNDLQLAFRQFLCSVPFYGLAILCADCPRVLEAAQDFHGRRVTYGFSEKADLRAIDLQLQGHTISFTAVSRGKSLGRFQIPYPGKHMALNSLAAIAVALELGVDPDILRKGLRTFGGVKRRLEVITEADGVTVMSDYGHHPTELEVTIEAVKNGWAETGGDLHVVFQPHRYSRTRDCFEQFVGAFRDCDSLLLTDIYSAGEQPIEGISAEALCARIDHPNANYLQGFEKIAGRLKQTVHSGDVVLCLGAGSVGSFAEFLGDYLNGQKVEFP